jgi:hypothetical protein
MRYDCVVGAHKETRCFVLTRFMTTEIQLQLQPALLKAKPMHRLEEAVEIRSRILPYPLYWPGGPILQARKLVRVLAFRVRDGSVTRLAVWCCRLKPRQILSRPCGYREACRRGLFLCLQISDKCHDQRTVLGAIWKESNKLLFALSREH